MKIKANLKPILRIKANTFNLSANLNLSVMEKLKFRTYSIHYSINESTKFNQFYGLLLFFFHLTSYLRKTNKFYFHSEFINYDYEDLNSPSFYSNMSECYTRCILESQCKSVSWNKLTSTCLLRLNTNVMKKCDFNTLCMTVPGKYIRHPE